MKSNKLILWILFLIVLSYFSMAAQSNSNQFTSAIFKVAITGKIVYCGKSDIDATIIYFKTRSKDTTLSQVTVQRDGSFSLYVNCEKGLYELCASHPDYVPIRIPFFVDSSISTEITLQPSYYSTNDTSVVFRYGTKTDSLFWTVTPKKGADNVWRAKVKSKSSEILYQVVGDEISGRTHCPSRYDRSIPDREGDLIGVIATKNYDSVVLEYRRQQFETCSNSKSATFLNTTIEHWNQEYLRLDSLMNGLRELKNRNEIPQWIAESYRIMNSLDSAIKIEKNNKYVLALLLKSYVEVAGIGWYTKQPKFNSQIIELANLYCQKFPDVWAIDRISAFPLLAAISEKTSEINQHLLKILSCRTIGNDTKSEILSQLDEVYTFKNQTSSAEYCKSILLSDYVGTTGYYILKDRLNDAEILGKTMKNIPTTDLEESLKTISANSKYILIDFWATWCKPCIAEMDNLKNAIKQFDANKFEIIGISLDDNLSKLKSFLAIKKIAWKNYLIQSDSKEEIIKFYSAQAIPRTILISPQGIVVAEGEMLRGEKLQETLERIIK